MLLPGWPVISHADVITAAADGGGGGSTDLHIYSVSQKSSPPKSFCDIFTQVKYISVKFSQHIGSSYLHILSNFGRFTLIFNKITLIFLGVPIIFNVFSFKFHQVKSP